MLSEFWLVRHHYVLFCVFMLEKVVSAPWPPPPPPPKKKTTTQQQQQQQQTNKPGFTTVKPYVYDPHYNIICFTMYVEPACNAFMLSLQ